MSTNLSSAIGVALIGSVVLAFAACHGGGGTSLPVLPVPQQVGQRQLSSGNMQDTANTRARCECGDEGDNDLVALYGHRCDHPDNRRHCHNHHTRLYVANFGGSVPNAITVYDEGGRQITLLGGSFSNVCFPVSMAFDASNHHLYVAMAGGDPPPNQLYANSTPIDCVNPHILDYDESGRQITLPRGSFPLPGVADGGSLDIAFDSSNHQLYVTNNDSNTILVYDERGKQIILPRGSFPNLVAPHGIVFDPSNHQLYVVSGNVIPPNGTITVYDESGKQIILPRGSFPNLVFPEKIAFDPSSHQLYVTNEGIRIPAAHNSITVYDESGRQIILPRGSFPLPGLSFGGGGGLGIVFDPSNHQLYVANTGINPGTVTVYDEGGKQIILPRGSFPTLVLPWGVTVVQ
jgi:DNA-binding beta-propeller fold protein YncE